MFQLLLVSNDGVASNFLFHAPCLGWIIMAICGNIADAMSLVKC